MGKYKWFDLSWKERVLFVVGAFFVVPVAVVFGCVIVFVEWLERRLK